MWLAVIRSRSYREVATEQEAVATFPRLQLMPFKPILTTLPWRVCILVWYTLTSALWSPFLVALSQCVTVKCNSLDWSFFQSTESSSILDPCFHQGYQRTINISDLFKNPCTSVGKKEFPFSQLYVMGEGNYEKCRRSIQNLFNKTSCPYSSCSFNGIYLPPLQGDFGVSLCIL